MCMVGVGDVLIIVFVLFATCLLYCGCLSCLHRLVLVAFIVFYLCFSTSGAPFFYLLLINTVADL